jgi:hypothetical protein
MIDFDRIRSVKRASSPAPRDGFEKYAPSFAGFAMLTYAESLAWLKAPMAG